jgi:hypothetical protein
MPYLTVAEFKERTIMPEEDVDELEVRRPGFLSKRLAARTGEVHARLGKRYAWPFATPAPEIVLLWLTQLVTVDAYNARGINPQGQALDDERKAKDEIKEAADSVTGLFELPLREDKPGTSAVEKGGPFVYSEASPYEWVDAQAEAIRGR